MTGAGGMAMILWALAQAAATGSAPATAPAPQAEAAPSPEIADERCLVAFGDLSGSPATAQVGRYGTLFFYGRLMGRDPGLDLAAALPAATRAVAGRMRAELTRCGHELEVAGHALAAVGGGAAGTAK